MSEEHTVWKTVSRLWSVLWGHIRTLAYVIGVFLFIVVFIAEVIGRWSAPSAGDTCGEGNHWRMTEAHGPHGGDLSCEPD